MISRKKIISRSTDDLDLDSDKVTDDSYDDDVWHSEDRLLKDHIQEILHKWERIDDEIWAKIVCMQKNRRVAKAYARAPVLTINGSYIGFDGYRIGLNGFDGPLKDTQIEEIRDHIGSGVKIKIDDEGNILIKRIGKENVFVKVWQLIGHKNNCLADDLVKNNGILMIDKSVKLFDMNKFVDNIQNELKNSYPDRRLLESQCISCVAFVRDCRNILELPIWIMIINIVALDLLKSKLIAPVANKTGSGGVISGVGAGIPTCEPKFELYGDCLEYHKPNPYHTHVDHHNCSANKLTLRRWRALYGPLLPLLPPRDVERDEKIRKLKEELEEVRIKIGNIGKNNFYL
ncbi:uncharacterized protein LOC128955941 [Oppia nitens]|uniref:uncharacterized protein LOC128955941 n=1 Tax=Oppia nitens TaxID=1686743 RepID=UPI0023DA0511|nr:uncharacterized protein LOC128955941 [Oppia nitens]